MFTSRAGLPNTINGGGNKPIGDNWEVRNGSEASVEDEEEE